LKLEINAVGDISLGDHPVCVGHGIRKAMEAYGESLFSEVEPELESSDINLCNIETVVSNRGFKKHSLRSFEMRGNPENISIIARAGFNLFGVANNHAMQHGRDAFDDMVEKISESDVALIGIDDKRGSTAVHEILHDNGKVSCIFAVSIRPEEWTKDRPVPYSLRESVSGLLEEVACLRSRYTGFLVCSIHWGLEFLNFPGPEQIDLGRRLIDLGVDVVFGHHPHVLQPVERYKNGLIFYSLGNFVFDLWPRDTKLTAIAKVKLEEGSPPFYKVVPIKISDQFKPSIASHDDSQEILKMMSWDNFLEQNELPGTDSEYRARYAHARREFRYSSYRYFISNITKYPLLFLIQSLVRTGLRRLSGN